MNAIEIKDLSKAFGEKRVLDALTLSLPHGEITCIMGESGCGKTTLLRILAGLETADGGNITGCPPSVLLFQEDRLFEDFSVLSNLHAIPLTEKRKEEIPRLLADMGLSREIRSKVRTLSGGMKRRVSLIRALLTDAPLLLLDEPFRGLDDESHMRAAVCIRQMTAGRTVIAVTHDARDSALLGAQHTVLLPAHTADA